MSTVLAENPAVDSDTPTAAERLRSTMLASKVSFTWFGVRKSLSSAQKERAADSFAAEATFLSAAKKLLDTRRAAYQAVTTVRGQILQHWKSLTLPYPEPGLRLIRQTDVTTFDRQLRLFQDELQSAVLQLDRQFSDLKDQSRERLGDLFNPQDYPTTLRDEFGVTWEFPAVEPPDYLRQLNPQLYEQECQRVQSRLPMHADLIPVLEALPRQRDGLVFHGPRGGRIKPDTLRNILVKEVLESLASRFSTTTGAKGFAQGRLHSFRHYFCSQCANSGVPERMLMTWLGHADAAMVRRYYHAHHEESQRQMNRVSIPAVTDGTEAAGVDQEQETHPQSKLTTE